MIVRYFIGKRVASSISITNIQLLPNMYRLESSLMQSFVEFAQTFDMLTKFAESEHRSFSQAL